MNDLVIGVNSETPGFNNKQSTVRNVALTTFAAMFN